MNQLSRRRFIQTGVTGIIGLSVLPTLMGFKPGANDTLRLGFIGLGQQAKNLANGFHKIPGVKIVAGCDVYGIKRQRFEKIVKAHQEELKQTVEIITYENYEDLLARKDIDAVVIATPDNWHAIQTMAACRAGKDIYLEKPVTFTIAEGIAIVQAVRENNIVLAVGSQQRSDLRFQHAVNMVRNGKLGTLKKINAWVGPPPTPYDLPEETIPAGLNWEKWLGPMPHIHYNSKLNPPISLDPVQDETFWANWRYYKETGGGFLCDWGAHNFDIAQWALNKDNGGPVKVIPAGVDGSEYINFHYDNGVVVANEPFNEKKGFGLKFWSDDAWIEVSREHFAASDDSLLPIVGEKGSGANYETGVAHLVNFIDAIKSRSNPIAPIEAGHRSGSLGILGNIATDLKRALQWDPLNQRFVNDPEADKRLSRTFRPGYHL